jgi:hypothetical protein
VALLYEEKTTNRVSPLLGTKSQCEGEGVVSEKKSCLRFVSCHFSCAREKKSRIERNEVDNPRTIIRRRLDDRGGTQTAFSPREHRFEYEQQRYWYEESFNLRRGVRENQSVVERLLDARCD